jgi:hypothetical protein
MEFDNRIVEHLLLPTNHKNQGWSSTFQQATDVSGQATASLNAGDVLEYLEYAWAAFVGTGGEWKIKADWFLEPATPALGDSFAQWINVPAIKVPTKRGSDAIRVRTTADQLASVKAAFGLSISQLAQVLKVGRPTVYSWFDSETGPETLRGANRDRLNQLCKLADEWNAISQVSPGRKLTATVSETSSLLDLLSAQPLEPVRIRAAFAAISAANSAAGESAENISNLGEKLRKRGFATPPSRTLQTKPPAKPRRT